MDNIKERAIQACRLLNDFVGDIIAATRVPEAVEQSGIMNQRALRVTRRMCFSHLIITLSKWAELYEHYASLIPEDCRPACKDLKKEIDRRKIRGFRNKCVGHIWDKKVKRPLTEGELDNYINAIVDNDPVAFVEWLNNPTANEFPNTVVSVVDTTRDRLREAFAITDNELFG